MNPFTITPAAAQEIRRQFEELGGPGDCCRVVVRGYGDNGFEFFFRLEPKRPNDVAIALDGVTVVVEMYVAMLLKASRIDFVDGDFKYPEMCFVRRNEE